MEQLFGTLEIRSSDDELREFTGIANTAALDSHGTVIEPSGARFALPIPLLWFHDQRTPVGEITHAELRNGAWHVKGTIRKVLEPGKVKDATDQAWHSLKYKLVRGLSIGFASLKEQGNRFIEWAWRELSLVTIPSNQEASIVSVRSAYLAASGDNSVKSPGVSETRSAPKFSIGDRVKPLVSHMAGMKEMVGTIKIAREGSPPYYGVKFDDMDKVHRWYAEDELKAADDESPQAHTMKKSNPGVSGPKHSPTNNPPRPKMTIQEQITQYENTRAAKVAQRDSLITRAGETGLTLDATEQETFDTLDTEIEQIDGHLVRLNKVKATNERSAVAVNGSNLAAGSNSRGTPSDIQNRKGVPIARVRSNEPPGLGFARYVMSIAASGGNKIIAEEYARRTFGPDRGEETALMLRSAVEPGTTQDADWAAPLVKINYLNEFLELLRPATIIGRVPGLRRVPFNISMPTQTAGGVYSWVGEAAAKPVGDMKFDTVTLGLAVAAGIIVITKQLARSSAPSAQEAVRDELIAGMARYLDQQFIDPSVSEQSNVSPASITYNVAGTPSAGATLDDVRTDFTNLMAPFVTSGLGLGGVVLLMNEGEAFALSMLTNEFGGRAFPDLAPTGGTIFNLPVVTSNTIVDQIIAAHTPSILFADDGQTEIDVSEQASLQMETAPDDPADGNTVYVSLWQRNLIALRAERWINWKVARENAVNVITGVGGTGS